MINVSILYTQILKIGKYLVTLHSHSLEVILIERKVESARFFLPRSNIPEREWAGGQYDLYAIGAES